MDVNSDLEAQLEKARALRGSIEAERDARKRAIDAEYAAKVKGLEKVIAGYLETLGLGQPALSAELEDAASPSVMALARAVLQREDGIKTIADSIMHDLRAVPGRRVTTDELTASALQRGFMAEAKNPKDSIRSILYDLAEKGQPIKRVAPKTWALVEAPAESDSAPDTVTSLGSVVAKLGSTYARSEPFTRTIRVG